MLSTKDEIALAPEPKLAEIKQEQKKFSIAILSENLKDEKRVALTPVGVATLVRSGVKVYMVEKSGTGANYDDETYRKAGAEIVSYYTAINNANVLVKISPFDEHQVVQLPPNKIIFSALHPNTLKKRVIELLQKKNATAIAYEYFTESNGFNPFTHLMNEITGSTSVFIAAELLSNTSGGKGIMLGGITGINPSEIIVLGTDTAAEYAIRIALGLGSVVKVFDDDLNGLLRFKQLFGQQLFTSTFNQDILSKSLRSADVLINSKSRKVGEEPFIITEELVRTMKPGSVIVDLKIDVGSVVETSEPTTFDKPTYLRHGIIHYCVPNIPSRVARTASVALSNVLTPILAELGRVGNILPLLKKYTGLKNATYIYLGMLTNADLAVRFKMHARNLNMILALF